MNVKNFGKINSKSGLHENKGGPEIRASLIIYWVVNNHPHLEDPQSWQIRQPSW